jgi:hypothetical protein
LPILDYTKYDSFVLLYPNSNVKKIQVSNIFETWNSPYEKIDFEIKSHRFYNNLYNLEKNLSINKLRQCGVGKASLFLYKTPVETSRLRPTFSEIKLCNIFAFDLKHALRSVDGKNLVHGSTDFQEYSDDICCILKYIESNDKYVPQEVYRKLILNANMLYKYLKKKFFGRLVYSYQKAHGYLSYLKFTILCFLNRKKIRPHLLSKWRWSSKYFVLEIGEKYFLKVPNKFEDIEQEKKISEILKATGCVEACEIFDCFGLQAIKKKWIDIAPFKLDDFYNPCIIEKLIKLFDVMLDFKVHHGDIKYDNLQIELQTGRIFLIDFGLSRSFEYSLQFTETIRKFDIGRWNDGWNLFDSIVQMDPMRLINNKDAYLAYSTLAGKYAACDDGLILITT